MTVAIEVEQVSGFGVDLAEELEQLVGRDPFTSEAAYTAVGIDVTPLALPHLQAALDADGGFVLVARDGRGVVGVMACRPEHGISEHFGIRCASGLWYSDLDGRSSIIRALAEKASVELREAGCEHLAIRSSVDDFEALSALQSIDFQVADTMISYLVTVDSAANPKAVEMDLRGLALSAHFGDDLAALDDSIGETFSELIREHYTLSRFHADPHFDSALASDWYANWCRKAFAGEWADGTMLARFEGSPIGFICWKRDDEKSDLLEREFFGSGLGASAGHGSYSAMLEAATLTSHFQWAAFDLHIANSPVVRALGRHRTARQMRVFHTLHRWLRDDQGG